MKPTGRTGLLLVWLAMIGCGDSPDPTSWISKSRVLGMLSSVEQDSTRSAARPGETVNLELILAHPTEPVANTYAFVVCEPEPALLGAATCRQGMAPVDVFIREEPSEDAPRFSVTVPDGTENNLLLVGAICMGGQVRSDLMDLDLRAAVNPCADEGVGQLITGAVFVQKPDRDINHIPTFEEIRFDDRLWDREPPAEMDACLGSGLPEVHLSDDSRHRMEVRPTPGSREAFLDPWAAPPGPDVEDLPVAFHATERGVRGLYSVVDAEPGETFEGATSVASLEFSTRDIEETPDATGRVIRFEIVMRDDRGGVSHVSRAVCLLP